MFLASGWIVPAARLPPAAPVAASVMTFWRFGLSWAVSVHPGLLVVTPVSAHAGPGPVMPVPVHFGLRFVMSVSVHPGLRPVGPVAVKSAPSVIPGAPAVRGAGLRLRVFDDGPLVIDHRVARVLRIKGVF